MDEDILTQPKLIPFTDIIHGALSTRVQPTPAMEKAESYIV